VLEPVAAIAYQGAGRRYFTRWGAARSLARGAINRHCDCDRGDHETPPSQCKWHEDHERWQRLVQYLARRYMRRAVTRRTDP
jgi:hypothetical protein